MPKQAWSAEEAASFKGMGLAIVELRENRKMEKAQLAAKAGISPKALLDIELGRADAKWGTLRKIAAALEIPLDAMFEMAMELAPVFGRAAKRSHSGSPTTANGSSGR